MECVNFLCKSYVESEFYTKKLHRIIYSPTVYINMYSRVKRSGSIEDSHLEDTILQKSLLSIEEKE